MTKDPSAQSPANPTTDVAGSPTSHPLSPRSSSPSSQRRALRAHKQASAPMPRNDQEAEVSRFRAIVELAPDALLVVDDLGQISLVNRQTELMFGYDRDELLGRPIELLIPERSRAIHRRHRTQFIAEPPTLPMRL